MQNWSPWLSKNCSPPNSNTVGSANQVMPTDCKSWADSKKSRLPAMKYSGWRWAAACSRASPCAAKPLLAESSPTHTSNTSPNKNTASAVLCCRYCTKPWRVFSSRGCRWRSETNSTDCQCAGACSRVGVILQCVGRRLREGPLFRSPHLLWAHRQTCLCGRFWCR